MRSLASTLRRARHRLGNVFGVREGTHCMAASGDDLRFVFEERRALQAAALLMQRAGGRMNYTKLLKLLYLADRRSLLEIGQPITGASFVLMKYGPVLSEVYECIRSEQDDGLWDMHVRTDGFDVVLIDPPGDDQLSDYDADVLTELSDKYRNSHYSHLVDIVHGLPEWRDPAPAKVRSLPVADILRAVGEDEASIAERATEGSRR